MKKVMKLTLFVFAATMAVPLLIFGSNTTVADEDVQLVVNPHAMGVDPDNPICPQTHDPYTEDAGDGWDYNEFITLSKCGNKNSDGGAMFKNGPTAYSGQGQPGQYAVMWQDYDMAALGFDGSDISYIFQVEIVSVRADDWQATLYSSNDGTTWINPTVLHNFPEAGSCGQGSKFPIYCGNSTIPYAAYMRLELKSLWSAPSSLGQKWANISLLASDGVEVSTPTPTIVLTLTSQPTATATPTVPAVTATATPFQITPTPSETVEATVAPGLPWWCELDPGNRLCQ